MEPIKIANTICHPLSFGGYIAVDEANNILSLGNPNEGLNYHITSAHSWQVDGNVIITRTKWEIKEHIKACKQEWKVRSPKSDPAREKWRIVRVIIGAIELPKEEK